MLVHDNHDLRDANELPQGMFAKILTVSIVSVIGTCLVALALFEI
ncbi:hypothetical protein [Flavobacterium psychrotrophum]|nr:hypothetical protein [Flavobacterium psychrotrophum]